MIKSLLVAFFLLTSVAEPKKDTENYDKSLSAFKNRVNKLTDVSFYEKIEFKHKTTGKVLHLEDFEDFDQQVFFIIVAENLSQNLEAKSKDWADVAKKLAADEEEKEKLDKAIFELDSLRKKHAKNWEKLTNSTFKKYKDKFSEEEMKLYKKQMQDYNDKNKLIERK